MTKTSNLPGDRPITPDDQRQEKRVAEVMQDIVLKSHPDLQVHIN